jgi:putative FmdB family regulatory protein
MPLYEYECDSCGHRFEIIQRFSDPAADACPKCQGPVHKLVSAPAIQFKGAGWYVTDYAKKGGENGSKAPSPAADKGSPEKGSTDKSSPASESASASPTTPSSTSGSSDKQS